MQFPMRPVVWVSMTQAPSPRLFESEVQHGIARLQASEATDHCIGKHDMQRCNCWLRHSAQCGEVCPVEATWHAPAKLHRTRQPCLRAAGVALGGV
jgi:hypothetical protein